MLGIELVDEVRESEIVSRLKAMFMMLKITGDPLVDFSLETLSKACIVK